MRCVSVYYIGDTWGNFVFFFVETETNCKRFWHVKFVFDQTILRFHSLEDYPFHVLNIGGAILTDSIATSTHATANCK